MSSREAHAAQRTLAQQRKLSKPLGEQIARSKKIWERLRIKSAVTPEERKELVAELFSIITGQIKDFVLKHDSVRVVQCALKYADKDQKWLIVQELRGSYSELAESKYGKFFVAKLVMTSDEARDIIVQEFEGKVKRSIRHPEAGWILDDIYRGAATPAQRSRLLREWYGPEFVVFDQKQQQSEGDLNGILTSNPEKRAPIMSHLKEMINLLVQKKNTGFTMLHDAMLQYFLNCKVGSPEHTEFLEMLKDDEEGDCVRNLAFTKSGSRLVCLALAYGSAKDRRNLLKFFKTHISLMAADVHACHVILTAYEVIDDTVMSSKAIFPELLGKEMTEEERQANLLSMAQHVTPRMALLYPLSPKTQKWLVTKDEIDILDEIREIRKETSKKDPEKRRVELVEAMSLPLLEQVIAQFDALAQSSFGCQFIGEVLLGASGDKSKALETVLAFVDSGSEVVEGAAFGRLLKSLVQGGRFDPITKEIIPADAPLKFHDKLYEHLSARGDDVLIRWATGANSFVILGMLESGDFSYRERLTKIIKKHAASFDSDKAGPRMILQHVGVQSVEASVKPKGAKKKS